MINIDELLNFSKTLLDIDSCDIGVILTRLVGITFDDRQDFLKLVKEDTKIKLEREYKNEYDANAVCVKADILGMWIKVGFISKEVNKEIAFLIDNKVKLSAIIEEVYSWTDDRTGKEFRGLCVAIFKE